MTSGTVLVVDDDVVCRRILTQYLESANLEVVKACDGQEAWEALGKEPSRYEAVVLDRIMPRMDGMELLRLMKQNQAFCRIPVILQTSLGAKEAILEGIQAGAYYYIPKPVEKDLLVSIVRAALRDYSMVRGLRSELNQFIQSMVMLQSGFFTFRTLEDAWFLSNLLSHACPEPEKVLPGLSELLVNAIEHGNLRIGYDGKTGLNETNSWKAEIDRRLQLPENQHKQARARFVRNQEEILFTIEDDGEGFNWEPYLELDTARIFDDHGRGIAMARLTSFDNVEFKGKGNVVVGMIRLHSEDAC